VRSYWAEDLIGWNTDLTRAATVDTTFHGAMWSKGDLLIAFSNGYHITDPFLLREWSKLKSRPRAVWRTRPARDMRLQYLSDQSFIYIYSAPRGHGFDFAWVQRRAVGSGLIIQVREIDLPLWVLALATAILPAAYTITHASIRRRRRHGLCPTCSYNLTGNASGVCPECGTAVAGRAEGVA
jgi:hypothetical protein